MLLDEITTTKKGSIKEQILLSFKTCTCLLNVITSYKGFSFLNVLKYLHLLIPDFRLGLLIKKLFVSDVKVVNAILQPLEEMLGPVQNPHIKGLEVVKS